MGNCLVTKLKENVNNDNLVILGSVIFTCRDYSAASHSDICNRIGIGAQEALTIYALGNTLLYEDAERTVLCNGDGKTMNIPVGSQTNLVRTGWEGGKVRIESKYEISNISSAYEGFGFNINDLEYSKIGVLGTGLYVTNNTGVTGDLNKFLEALSKQRSANSFMLCDVVGTSCTFGKWPSGSGIWVVFDGNGGCKCYETKDGDNFADLFYEYNGTTWIEH